MLSAKPPNRNGRNERPSSASIRAAITADSPIPPYSVGVCTPKKPDCRALSTKPRYSSLVRPGWWLRSRRSAVGSSGRISRWTKVRTQSRVACSSVLSEKSIWPSSDLGFDDDLADQLAVLHGGQPLGHLVQRQRPVDPGPQPGAGQQVHQVGQFLPGAHGRADHLQLQERSEE